MNHGDERFDDMATEHDEQDETVFEADTAELKVVSVPPAPAGETPASAGAAPSSRNGEVTTPANDAKASAPDDMLPAPQETPPIDRCRARHS